MAGRNARRAGGYREAGTEMTTSVEIRANLVDTFRRDLVGPHPTKDLDLARERLNESPSRWYLTGVLAPVDDPLSVKGETADVDPAVQEEMEIDVEEPETPNARRRFLPSSVGLTALLDPDITEIEVQVSWGDYRTEPPLPETVLLPDVPQEDTGAGGKRQRIERPPVDWVRLPKERTVHLVVRDGRGDAVIVPDSGAEQR